MAFDRSAIKNDALFVTINGQRKTMKVANMTDEQIKTALGRADNAGALATGWVRLPNGTIQRQATTPTGTSTPTPTAGAGQTATGVTQGGTQNSTAQPVIQPPVITPVTPVALGPTQAEIARARQQAATSVAGINANMADLTANNFGRYNSQLNILNRDAGIQKHDYNAQSNAAGFRRSGGVRTNNNIVNAAASQGQQSLYDTVGQGAVNKLGIQKNQVLRTTIDNLLGGWASGLSGIYEGY